MAEQPQFNQIIEQITHQLTQFTQTFTNQLQQVQIQVNEIQNRNNRPPQRQNEYIPTPKLVFPRFESGDPTEWLYKVNKFFEYYQTPETHKLSLATLHLDGAASTWFQWMETNHLVRYWPEFEMQIRIRFGPSPYEDPNTQLAKLKQIGTIADYEVKFQSLTNKIPGLPESILKGCYIGGLKHDIQCEVIASQPYNLQQAIGLSKLYEEKFNYGKTTHTQPEHYQSSYVQNPKPVSMFPPIRTNDTTTVVPEKTSYIKNEISPYHKLPIKRLTYEERQAKMEKNQCYNCEEKWHKGHVCKGQMSLLLLDGVIPYNCNEITRVEDTDLVEEIVNETERGSLYALIGNPSSKCLRMQGEIKNKMLQILIDGGSSHNFMQTRIVRYLGLAITPSTEFSVIVGNGQNLKCVGQCLNVKFTIQGHQFKSDFYVFDLYGADAVLGVMWQESLGEIKINFREAYLKFQVEGTEVCLQAFSPTITQPSMHSLQGNLTTQTFLHPHPDIAEILSISTKKSAQMFDPGGST